MKGKVKLAVVLILMTFSLVGTAAERSLWRQYVNFVLVRVECINVEGGCLGDAVITPDDPPPPPTEEEEEPYRFKHVEDGGEQ